MDVEGGRAAGVAVDLGAVDVALAEVVDADVEFVAATSEDRCRAACHVVLIDHQHAPGRFVGEHAGNDRQRVCNLDGPV